MKRARLLFLLLAGILLLAGCQKEGRIGGNDAINFSAVSNPGTKTVYGGEYANNRELIKWLENDEIRIFSDKSEHRYHEGQHWADYVIKSVSNSGVVSKGVIDNVPGDGTGNGLIWKEAGDYKFFAIYPPTDCEDGHKGKFNVYLPNTQAIDITGRAPFTPGMDYAVMTAAKKITTTQDGEGPAINMDFEPAFTAFEFTFTSDIPVQINSMVLYTEIPEGGNPIPIAGQYTVEYDENLNVSYKTNSTTAVIPVTFGQNKPKVSSDNAFTFSVFALPVDITNLVVTLTVKGEDWETPQQRKLRLFYKNGNPVVFAGCLKHQIKATIQADYSFKSITLNGVAVGWTDEAVPVATDNTPQSTQFAVVGEGILNVYEEHFTDENKAYRQTWILGDKTANVSFKVFSPVNGSFEVKPFVKKANGDIVEGSEGFTVAGTLSGQIGGTGHAHFATQVEFTVKANGADDGDQLFFKTFVTNGGITQSLDSETQLYDTRGYHYFMVNDPLN